LTIVGRVVKSPFQVVVSQKTLDIYTFFREKARVLCAFSTTESQRTLWCETRGGGKRKEEEDGSLKNVGFAENMESGEVLQN